MSDALRPACAHVDPEVFFPLDEEGTTPGGRARVDAAKDYCRRCPLVDGCLRMAFTLDDPGFAVGIFGGMTGPERDRARATPADVLLARHAATAASRHRRRPSRRAARCVACGTRQHLLLTDGSVTKHPRTVGGRWEPCPGSRKQPEPEAVSLTKSG